MNNRQRESIAKYCYSLSQAIDVGWMIGIATGKLSLIATLMLAGVGFDLFVIAYKHEEELS